jgi:hypothetical protein
VMRFCSEVMDDAPFPAFCRPFGDGPKSRTAGSYRAAETDRAGPDPLGERATTASAGGIPPAACARLRPPPAPAALGGESGGLADRWRTIGAFKRSGGACSRVVLNPLAMAAPKDRLGSQLDTALESAGAVALKEEPKSDISDFGRAGPLRRLERDDAEGTRLRSGPIPLLPGGIPCELTRRYPTLTRAVPNRTRIYPSSVPLIRVAKVGYIRLWHRTRIYPSSAALNRE